MTIILGGMVMSNFRARQHVEEGVNMAQPTHNKLIVRTTEHTNRYDDTDFWSDIDFGKHGPLYSISEDSFLLTTVRLRVLKSEDTAYHVQLVKISRGSSATKARETAGRIEFPVRQTDSVLTLPQGFAISSHERFRNQQVIVEVAVPVGKRILINRSVEDYHWFTINPNNRHIRWRDRNWNMDWDQDDDDGESYSWSSNVEYVMTPTGLSRTGSDGEGRNFRRKDKKDNGNKEEDLYKERPETPEKAEKPEKPGGNDGYRYKGPGTAPKAPDTTIPKKTAQVTEKEEAMIQPYPCWPYLTLRLFGLPKRAGIYKEHRWLKLEHKPPVSTGAFSLGPVLLLSQCLSGLIDKTYICGSKPITLHEDHSLYKEAPGARRQNG
ncbi:hypothetical protein ACQ86N_44395 [Puia sp. P3]|uniref:hypothetical protein n=1 Tax=Puia sp. P3 TaxID=3423952 RepID=UPI003D67C293